MISGKTTLFGVVVAVAAGLFGANIAQIHDDSQKVLSNSLVGGVPILGHVEIVARDSNGNIIAYRQGDNLIVVQGLNCIGQALFRTVAATVSTDPINCGGSASAGTLANFNTASGFRFIEIGTASTTTALMATRTSLVGAVEARTLGVPTFTPFGSASSASATGTGPSVTIQGTISITGATQTIQEAGLFDGASGTPANMFARQTFAAITLSTGDTLTVTWTITLAHG